jgi:hypothetical protein
MVLHGGKPVGRIYEDTSVSAPRVRPLEGLAQDEEPSGASGEARGGKD